MTAMDDFTAFLAGRYDEAEAKATPGRDALDDLRFELKRGDPYEQHLAGRIEDGLDSQAMVWHELVLRDIALKRAILAAYVAARAAAPPVDDWYEVADGIKIGHAEALEQAVRQLGTEFSDHADYRPAWGTGCVTMSLPRRHHEFFWWSHGCKHEDPGHEGPHVCECGHVYEPSMHSYGYDADEERRDSLMRQHGYDPSLPPRGVSHGEPPEGLRNHVCYLEDTEIDGHRDPDRSGLCIHCSARIED